MRYDTPEKRAKQKVRIGELATQLADAEEREAKYRKLAVMAQSVIDWEQDYRTINNLGRNPPSPFCGLATALAACTKTGGSE